MLKERINGALFRAYLSGIEAMGLRPEVRSRVSPSVLALMERPPLPSAWLPGHELTELFSAVLHAQGLQGVRQLGYEATRRATLPLLKPDIDSVLSLHGRGPEVLLRHFDRLVQPFFRGMRFTWRPESPRSGTVEVRSTYEMTPTIAAAWEGSLLCCFEACGVQGSVAPSVLGTSGHVGTMKVSW